jgi:pyruvate/2-oxoglutarate dehydrogenase complex dihydrolipoamide acyltransferase (E2) component
MPKLSLGTEQGVVVEWYVSVGADLSEGAAVASVETDKAIPTLSAQLMARSPR